MPLYFGLSEKIKSTFVSILKKGFRSNLAYPFIDDKDTTEITIIESWTTDFIKYPVMSVDGGDATDYYRRTIGDHKEDITLDVSFNGITYSQVRGVRVGGTFPPTVTITIAAESVIQRDQIADWAAMYIRHLFIEDLRKFGIEITGIRRGTNSQVVIGNDPIFWTDIICDTLVDWEESVVVDPVQTIKGICKTTIIETMIDGSTFSSDN